MRAWLSICAVLAFTGCRSEEIVQATYCLIRTPMSAETQNRFVVTAHGAAYMTLDGIKWTNGDNYELTERDLGIVDLKTAIVMMNWEEAPTRYLPICVDQIAPGTIWSAPRQMGRHWWE